MSKGIVNFIKPTEPIKKSNKSNKRNKTSKPRAKVQKDIKVDNVSIDTSALSISSVVDSSGINVIVKYLHQPIHIFSLPANQYDAWIKSNPQQRCTHVFSNTNIAGIDAKIKQLIINKTIQLINSIFARAQARRRL